ncbi:MAG: tyrosine-type recombinase/integrase [Solirubrobacteraceae bacterium]|jgi:site-specific recombinase XerD
MLDLDLGAVHQPGFRPFMIRGESSAYWTVYDGGYEPVEVADCYLRQVRFGSGKALGTTRMYAGNLALFFEFCLASGRSLRRAAFEFDRFVHYLAVTPIERRGRGQGQLRSRERVNHILGSVRELYREAVARGVLDGEVLSALFRVERSFRLPTGVVEDQQLTLHERPRHRLRVAKRGRPATASVEQFVGLMAACRTWRDRSILALLGRAGLRRGEAVTLRVSDVHLAESSSEVGCSEPGPHVHVRRREDVDGGATKSLDPRIVPADELVVFCLDQYLLLERAAVTGATGCDRLLVNLASAYRGLGMTPDRVGALLGSLSRRAGLEETVTPHRLRHGFASELEASGAGLVLIQELLGHRQITSTQVYVQPGAGALRAAVERAYGRTRAIADAVGGQGASGVEG